jgi:C1A family cysteine protease
MVPVDWSKTGKPFEEIRYTMVQSMASGQGSHDIRELTPISDQGHAGSCVANGCSDMFEMLMGLDGHAVVQLSRRWLYYVSRAYHGAQNVDKGTFIAAAMHQLQTLGTFEEKYFPYADDADHIVGAQSHPTLDCYTMATENRIQDFYWLDPASQSFLDDAEVAIRADHPAVLAVQVGQEWMDYRGEDRVFDAPAASVGGHCMIVSGVGYESGKRFWRLRNSWSSAWGDQGHGRISDSYLLSASEVCVGTRMSAAA